MFIWQLHTVYCIHAYIIYVTINQKQFSVYAQLYIQISITILLFYDTEDLYFFHFFIHNCINSQKENYELQSSIIYVYFFIYDIISSVCAPIACTVLLKKIHNKNNQHFLPIQYTCITALHELAVWIAISLSMKEKCNVEAT